MLHQITIMPSGSRIAAPHGISLMDALRAAGLSVDAPCGGEGRCGKCRVLVNGQEQLACRTLVDQDMTVQTALYPPDPEHKTIPAGITDGVLAFDIGTTTVVGYLLDANSGQELACESRPNPQRAFGADVISRIRYALQENERIQTQWIRRCLTDMTQRLCAGSGVQPAHIRTVSIVGNPAMQQLFLGLPLHNLARIPYAPEIICPETRPAKDYLPLCENAKLLIAPNIGGFVGSDTTACILASGMDHEEEMTLLVDIGTNGEMVLGNCRRMAACSTAAGPALEGANIAFGMRAENGAIDHVRLENGQMYCSVIGGGEAVGICGSGLMDAVAAALDAGLIDSRGRILSESKKIPLTDRVYLTQEDIRQVQLAKGAMAAGVTLLAAHLGVSADAISRVYLAGAFGSVLDPRSACRIGLLPAVLESKTQAIGNAAGSGAKQLAWESSLLIRTGQLVSRTEFIELASVPEFRRCFAESMRF